MAFDEKESTLIYRDIKYKKNLIDDGIIIFQNPPSFNKNSNPIVSFTHIYEKGNRSLYLQIISIIEEAILNDSFLLISSFIITSYEIIEKLKEACLKLPSKVCILIGRDEFLTESLSTSDDLMSSSLIDLLNLGALIRMKEGAHLKFLVTNNKAIITSANLTSPAIDKNPEFGLIFKDNYYIVFALKKIFAELWNHLSEKILIDGNWIEAPKWQSFNYRFENELPLNKIILSNNNFIESLNENEIIVNPDELYSVILTLIESAKVNIKLSFYLIFKNKKIDKILDILKQKAKKGVSVHILLPETRVQQNFRLKEIINELEKSNIIIKYYRALHGKSILVDNQKALFLTSNLDKHLVSNNSYDIGYLCDNKTVVENFNLLYNHLWEEAITQIGKKPIVDLNLSLVIQGREYISKSKQTITVSNLNNIIEKCDHITYYEGKNECLIVITTGKLKLNIPIQIKYSNNSSEYITINGIIKSKEEEHYNFSEGFLVSELNLRLLWFD